MGTIWDCRSGKCPKREFNRIKEMDILNSDDCIDFDVEDGMVFIKDEIDEIFGEYIQNMYDNGLIPDNSTMSIWYLVDENGKETLNLMGWTLSDNYELDDEGYPEFDYYINIL